MLLKTLIFFNICLIYAREKPTKTIYFQDLGVLLEPTHQNVAFYKEKRDIYLTRVWSDPCEILYRIEEDQTHWPCKSIPTSHFKSLVTDVVNGCRAAWKTEMQNLRTSPDFEHFAETSKNVLTNVSSNFKILPASKVKPTPFSEIVSRGLDIVERLNENFSVIGIVKNLIASFTYLRYDVCAAGHGYQINLNKGRKIAREFMHRVERDVQKLRIGSTPSSEDFFNLYIDSCMILNSDRHFCEKFIQSDYFRVSLEGVKPIGNSLHIFIKFPVFIQSEIFYKQTLNEVSNVGFNRNNTHFKVDLPNQFIISKNGQIFDLNSGCTDFCDSNSLLISSKTHCLKGLIENKKPKCFVKKMRPGFKCLITKNFIGPLVYANNATFLSTRDVHPIKITGNRLLTTSGNLTCNMNNSLRKIEISAKVSKNDYETRLANDENFVHEKLNINDLFDHVRKTTNEKTILFFTNELGFDNKVVFPLLLGFSVLMACLTGFGLTDGLKKRLNAFLRRLSLINERSQSNVPTENDKDLNQTQNIEPEKQITNGNATVHIDNPANFEK